jgi:lactam utilization protein B
MIPLEADTICVHGDNAQSVEIVTQLRQALEQSGVLVVAF